MTCLLCEHEDLSLEYQRHRNKKLGTAVCIFNPSAGEVETRGPLGLLASLSGHLVKDLCQVITMVMMMKEEEEGKEQ